MRLLDQQEQSYMVRVAGHDVGPTDKNPGICASNVCRICACGCFDVISIQMHVLGVNLQNKAVMSCMKGFKPNIDQSASMQSWSLHDEIASHLPRSSKFRAIWHRIPDLTTNTSSPSWPPLRLPDCLILECAVSNALDAAM